MLPVLNNYLGTCDYFNSGQCRSCNLIDLEYQQQINIKTKLLVDLFAQAQLTIGQLEDFVISRQQFATRNKCKIQVSGSILAPVLGLVNLNNNRELLNCPLHLPIINAVILEIKSLITQFKIQPYSISSQKGFLKYIILRSAQDQQQVFVRFVLKDASQREKILQLSRALTQKFAEIKVVAINLQPIAHSFIEGPEEEVISSSQQIKEKLGEFVFNISPQSFTQINSQVAKDLYKAVADFVSNKKVNTLLDLFCGIGGFSIFSASLVEQVIGVELSTSSIKDALSNAQENNLTNCKFIAADVEKYLLENQQAKIDCVVINPPRRGLSPEIVKQLIRLKPKSIAYSSCNPETLVRDLKELSQNYKIEKIIPFDMFPLTKHFETLALLEHI